MASKEELSEQLAVTQKLAAAVDMMAKSMSRVESSYDSQITAVEKLTRAIETLKGQDFSQLNSTKLSNVQKEFKRTQKQATSLTGRMKDLGNQMSKKFPMTMAVGAAALGGFVQGLRNVLALSKGVTGFFASFVDSAANIAASIIAIPFKMFNALVDTAAAAGSGMSELAQAIENLRKEMGDLKGPAAHAVLETSKTLQGFSDTGLSAWRVFGTMAERIELVTKLAVGMGATFGKLTDDFKRNGGALLAFQKGLGLSEEGMKALGDRSITMGVPLSKTLLDVTKQTTVLGKAFDVDQKLIGKDMQKAAMDVKHFGGMTVKEIGQASVYARKLGLELDKIVGTLDAFETFDSAAENAAKLSQAFGVSVDAFKMMEAQSPAEQIEMLRKSFKDAGVDTSTFTRQQAKLLAQTTGLEEGTIKQALSLKNEGLSLDQVKKKSEEAAKKTMTQAEAMGKLADSIERMVKSGTQEGGFWQQFVKGFLGGIQRSKEFREIIWNIKKSLQLVYFEGVKLGKAFVEMFPGVKQFLQGIADFFKPEKFKRLTHGVVDVLKQWMKDLSDPNGKASFTGLMYKLKKKFFDFFDMQSSSGKKMLDGFKTVFKTVTRIVSEAIVWVSDKIGDGIRYIADLISGNKKLDTAGAAGGLGFFGQLLDPLIGALSHAWRTIAPALWDLVRVLGKKLFEFLKSDEFIGFIKPAIPILAAVLFGPSMAHALLGALTVSLGKAAVGALGKGSSKIVDMISGKTQEFAKAEKKVPKTEGGGVLRDTKNIGKDVDEAIKGSKNWGVQDAVKLGAKLVAIAAAIAVGGVLMAGAVVAMKWILKKGGIEKPEDAYAPLMVLGATILAMVPAVIGMKIVSSSASPSEVLKGGLVVAAAAAIVGVTGGILGALLSLIDPVKLKSAGDFMLNMSLVFLAMVPLILASMVIGLLASGPQAIALVAAAVGLGVIGAAVAEMAGISVVIIQELANLPIDKSFQVKVDAFIGVMKVIQSFTETLVHVIKMMQPSLLGFLTHTEEKFTTKLAAAQELIKTMIGEHGTPGGLIGMIEIVKTIVKQIGNAGPKFAQGAQIFSSVMEAIASMLKALTPPDAFFEAGNSFLQRLVDPAWNYSSLTADVQNYSQKMQAQVMGMIRGDDGKGGVLGLLDKLTGVRIPNADKTKVVVDVISALANIMKTITPDAETIKSMQESGVKGSYAWGLLEIDNKKQGIKPEVIAQNIAARAKGLQDIISTITTGPLKAVIDSVGTMSTQDLNGVKAVADIMKVVVDLATALGTATKGKETITVEKGKITRVTDMIPDIADVIGKMGPSLKTLLDAMIVFVKTLPNDKLFTKNMETAGKLFGVLGDISKVVQSISETSKGMDIKGNVGEAFARNVEDVAEFIDWIVLSKNGKPPVLERIVASFQLPIFSKISIVEKSVNTLKVTLETLGNVVDVIDKLQKSIPKAKGNAGEEMAHPFTDVAETLDWLSLPKNGKPISVLERLIATFKLPVFARVGVIKTGIMPLKSVVDSISEVMDSIKNVPEFKTAPEVMALSIKNVADFMSQISSGENSSMNTFAAAATNMSKYAAAMKTNGIIPALDAVTKMVQSANALDTALSDGNTNKIDVRAKLEQVARAVGLGGKAQVTITNKMAQITVNMTVEMNAADMEKAMILRANSVIRQRLDFLAEKNNTMPLISSKAPYNEGKTGVPALINAPKP